MSIDLDARSAWRWMRLALGAGLAATLVACSDSGGDPPAPPPPPPITTGTVTGLALSAVSGAPMGGVTVSTGSQSTTTGADGRFTLANVPAGAAVLAFAAPDHTRAFANAAVAVGQTATTQARLSPVGTRQTYSAAVGATITMAGSPAQVSLPAAGIVDRSGVSFSGMVTVELSPINPALDPGNMPGDMTTRLGGGEVVPIESWGAMAVNLSDAAGNRLNLAAGSSATIRIPLATRDPSPPATVPLFWFDESTGLWVQEGTATLAGTAPDQYYEGTVTHFTVWNADQVMNTIQVVGCLQDAAGARVANAAVRSEGLNYSGVAYATTDANGNFSVAMRRGSTASVAAESGALYSNSVTAGPSESTITLTNCLALGNGTPVFVRQPESQSVNEGGFLVLQALARGQAPLRYQWMRDGVDIPGATTTALVIDPVGNADNGALFTVRVSNSAGAVTSTAATLTVASLPPAFATQPQAQSVVTGAAATFSVQMLPQGAPLQFQWLRNGQVIDGATQASYTLAAAQLTDNGAAFSVRVSNSVQAITSSAATLTVTAAAVAPAISQQPLAATAFVGQGAQFSVLATGSEPLRYQWRRNGADIEGATGASYTLNPVALSDNGAVFSVVVANSAGSVTSAAVTLTVTDPPADSGYYLVAHSGLEAQGAIVFANGAQTFRAPALVAVNSQSPNDGVVTIEPAGTAVPLFMTALETSLQGGQLSNTRERYSFYFKGSRLYRLDHVSLSGAPVGQVVSSLQSTDVCGEGGMVFTPNTADGLTDLAQPGRSWVLMRGPGADSQCFTPDDEVRAVRADMSATTAALRFSGEPLLEILGSDGSFQGVLVVDGQTVRRLDANLANPVTVHTFSSTNWADEDFTYGPAAPTVWLFADGASLYGYRLDGSGGAPTVLATLTPEEQQPGRRIYGSRGGTAFVALSNGESSRILRINASLEVSTVAATGPGFAYDMAVTPTRLVFSSMQGIISIPQAGGAATTLASTESGQHMGTMEVAGETVYYGIMRYGQETPPQQSVGIVNSDGSNPQTWADSTIVGSLLAPSVTLGDAMVDDVHALIIAQGVTAEGQMAGSSLRAVLGSTRATLVTYGNLPTQPSPLVVFRSGFSPFHYGQPGLLTLLSFSDEGEASDLVYFDSDAQGLIRLTNNLTAVPVRSVMRPLAVRAVSATPAWLAVREGLLRVKPAQPGQAAGAGRR